jgi:DNA polymerase-3 subunit beta
MVKEIKAASLFTTTGVNAVNFDLVAKDQVVKIASTSTQTGEYASEIEAEVQGEDNTTLLNHRYLLDGLNNMGTAEVEMKVINGDSPCILAPKGDETYLYIVMPIRK